MFHHVRGVVGFLSLPLVKSAGSCTACSLSDSAWVCGTNRRPRAPRATVARVVATPRMMADAQTTENDIKSATEARMTKTMEATSTSFNTIRTGRASATILDRVHVDYYNTETPLNQLAAISVSGGSTIVVDPYDKSCMKDIERALVESDVGLTPSNTGDVIRLNVPQLTNERRKELAKQVKSLAEEGRVAIRNIRRDAVDECRKLEKDKKLSQDGSKSIQDVVQKLTDKYIKKIDELYKEKEKDIMTV